MSQTLDYSTDAGKLGMAFTLLRVERKGGLSPEEKIELHALFDELKSWTPERRIVAATQYDKLVGGTFKYPAKFFA